MMRSPVLTIPELVRDARALRDAEALALARGHREVALLLAESRCLTLGRLLRHAPQQVTLSASGEVHVPGEGIVGTLTAAEAAAAGVAR